MPKSYKEIESELFLEFPDLDLCNRPNILDSARPFAMQILIEAEVVKDYIEEMDYKLREEYD